MRRVWHLIALLLPLFALACGEVNNPDTNGDDAGGNTTDAGGTIDAGIQPDADTTPDASVPIQSGPPNTEFTSGGGKMNGSVYSLDVQLGHPWAQSKASGGGKTTEGAAAVKP